MELELIEQGFGAVVSGARLKGPGLEDEVREIERLLDEHLLLVFRNTDLDREEYSRFGSYFGQLEDFPFFGDSSGGRTFPISNTGDDGRIRAPDDPLRRNIAADALWHTDNSYRINRARYSALLAETLPLSGGETEFANTRAAYEALPDDMKRRLDGLVGLHSIIYSRTLVGYAEDEWPDEFRAKMHPVPQPLVHRNERNGRRSLYIASHIAGILGMPTGEARDLAEQLIDFATQPRFVYSHAWRSADLVIWDDRATMHRRAPYDDLNEVRKLHTLRVVERSELYDPAADYEQMMA